jgi:hypothetical protein
VEQKVKIKWNMIALASVEIAKAIKIPSSIELHPVYKTLQSITDVVFARGESFINLSP